LSSTVTRPNPVGTAQVLPGGIELLTAHEAALDELHALTATPVTARRTWLRAWIECNPAWEPLAILVPAGEGGLAAAAFLARRPRPFWTEYVALGHPSSDQVRLAARDAAAASELARGIVACLASGPAPWRLCLAHLPAGDPVAAELVERLPFVKRMPGDLSATLRFGNSRDARALVTKKHHREVRRFGNRLEREGLVPLVQHVRDPAAIAALLPEMEAMTRARDLELIGHSTLDRGTMRAFFRAVVLGHAALGEVELTTLRLGGELAAYMLCFLDGTACRAWACRHAPHLARYAPGLLNNYAAIERAVASGFQEFDWMRGDEGYKERVSNDVVRAEDLLAWSSSLQVLTDAPRELRVWMKAKAPTSPFIGRALVYARRAKLASRRLRSKLS
jgi:CelD/BcsL family acetyltransferase involved in cellulose biosynthesis